MSAPRGFLAVGGLALLSMAGLALVLLGRQSNALQERNHLDHLADTAALSAANQMALALNYEAYANRAIAANEAMIAQSLTLAAWVDQLEKTSGNGATLAQFIPYLGPTLQAVHRGAEVLRQATHAAVATEVPLRSFYTRALGASQQAMHASASPFFTQSLVNEVVWSADRRAFGQTLATADVVKFSRALVALDGNARSGHAAHLQQTLDPFTNGRSFDRSMVPIVTCVPRSASHLLAPIKRRGATALSEDYSGWVATDTLSLHFWRRGGRFNPFCRSTNESIPLGWGAGRGASTSSFEGSPADSGLPSSAVVHQANAINPSARSSAESSPMVARGYLGLASLRDFADGSAESRRGQRFRVPVMVRLPQKQSRFARGDQEPLLGGALWSLAVAEAVFSPPEGSPELPSLFQPYWLARLGVASLADEALAVGLASKRQETP